MNTETIVVTGSEIGWPFVVALCVIFIGFGFLAWLGCQDEPK